MPPGVTSDGEAEVAPLVPTGGWVLGTGSSSEGDGHGPELPEFKECLDSTLTESEFWVVLCGSGSCDLSVKLFYRFLALYNTQQVEFPNTIKK